MQRVLTVAGHRRSPRFAIFFSFFAGKPFYGEYEAQEMVDRFVGELGITILKYHMVVYVEDRAEYGGGGGAGGGGGRGDGRFRRRRPL
jgi:hypothetical protein